MQKKGFTLVELMIAITIIAILATIALVSFTRVQKQARDTKRKAEIKTFQTGLQAYYNEKNSYPIVNTPDSAATVLASLVPTYVSGIPIAPAGTSGINSDYMYVSDGTTYALCVQLETPTTSGSMWKVDTSYTSGREIPNASCTIE